MIKTIIFTALLTLTAAAAHAEELAPRAKLMLLLSAHHALPDRPALERAVPEARARLLELARDPKLASPYRARAFSALAAWPDDQVHALYAAAARDERGPLQHRALMLLATTFRDRTTVASYLTHTDLALQLTARAALARLTEP